VAAIAVQNKATVYTLLFRATAETLRIIAADPRHLGAQLGFFAVLHTWGQTLVAHPHLHCVIPGGGLSPDGTPAFTASAITASLALAIAERSWPAADNSSAPRRPLPPRRRDRSDQLS
jgi:hypothetical protein